MRFGRWTLPVFGDVKPVSIWQYEGVIRSPLKFLNLVEGGHMNADWVLDVLADLRTFARQNQFVRLSEQLDDSILIAAEELKSARTRRNEWAGGDEGEARIAHHGSAGREVP